MDNIYNIQIEGLYPLEGGHLTSFAMGAIKRKGKSLADSYFFMSSLMEWAYPNKDYSNLLECFQIVKNSLTENLKDSAEKNHLDSEIYYVDCFLDTINKEGPNEENGQMLFHFLIQFLEQLFRKYIVINPAIVEKIKVGDSFSYNCITLDNRLFRNEAEKELLEENILELFESMLFYVNGKIWDGDAISLHLLVYDKHDILFDKDHPYKLFNTEIKDQAEHLFSEILKAHLRKS